MSKAGEEQLEPSVVTLQVTTEITGTPEEVLAKQHEAVTLLAGLGGVAVTLRQLDGSRRPILEPGAEKATAEFDRRDPRLLMSVDALLLGGTTDTNTRTKAVNALKRENAYTARDVLAFGQDRVKEIRNFGKKSMTIVEESFAATFGDSITWEKDPNAYDIAKLYDSAYEIPQRLLDIELPWTSEIKTVGDVLSCSLEELSRQLGGNESRAERLLRDANNLKHRFEVARTRLLLAE